MCAPKECICLNEKGVLVAARTFPIQDRPMAELTQLLEAMRAGDSGAIDEVFTLTYRELHAMAHQRLHRSNRVTSLDTTALVHECYLRLVRLGQLQTRDRSHFLGYAARVMRSIVVDFVRQRLAKRRGGDELRVTLGTDIRQSTTVNEEQIMQVDEALQELAVLDPRLVEVVEMRYFAGFTVEQIAESRGVTTRTIRRDWEKARLLLYAALKK
jgi:RNA polymerase sigma factor (TIGR02999 family)